MKKFIPLVILIILILAIALATYRINEQTLTDLDSKDSSIHFNDVEIKLAEFELPDLFDEKKKFSNANLQGEYHLVSFFASWCSTCRAQHDVLMRIKNENIIDIYGIAWRDIKENTKSYLEKSGNPYKLVASDSKALFSKIAEINAVPETWIVDKNGVVVMRYRGNLQEFALDEIKNFLEQNK